VPEILVPKSIEDVQTCVQAALDSGEPLEVIGGGSKRDYGRAVQAPRTLSTRDLAGIVDYQPHELILVARPGTPIAEVEALLEQGNQMLAFEPPQLSEGATLGGILSCNLSGPRRFKAGAARDHLLGFRAVTGRGEVVNGGGRVVKNVTGYDMPKLMCGSFGTLAVMTEVVVKVLPRAETERTVVITGLEEELALRTLTGLTRTPHEPSGLAHWPQGATCSDAVRALANGGSATLVRLEGPGPSLEKRIEALRPGLPGIPEILLEEDSRACWMHLKEVAPLPLDQGERLWRFSLPPGSAPALAQALDSLGVQRRGYDWGGGLVWAVTGSKPDPAKLHALLQEHGGHAQVLRDRADPPAAEPFTPLTPGQHRLNLNLKAAFDPLGILNPGRMYEGL